MPDGLKTDIEEFEQLPTAVQRAVLFKAIVDIGKKIEDHNPAPKCAAKFKQLENQKKWNVAAASAGGLIGGVLFWLSKVMFWK